MSFSAVPITTVGRKLYLGACERKFFERHYFLRLQKRFSRKVGEHMHLAPPPPPPVPTALPINTDKEIENKFLVFGPVKMLQEHEYISFILNSEVHNDEAPHFSGCREPC